MTKTRVWIDMRSQEHAPVCPKCGYDQSGEIQTWTDECPVHGTCPECGLAFPWSHVMRPELAQVSWYVEHAKSIRGFIDRSKMTPFYLVLPNHFWKQLDPVKPVSIWRLVLWAALFIFVVHTAVAIPNGYNAWIRSNWSGVDFPRYYQMHGIHAIAELFFDAYCYPYVELQPKPYVNKWIFVAGPGFDESWIGYFGLWVSDIVGALVAWVVLMLAIPQTRRLAKLRKRHVVRAVIISVVMIVLSYELLHFIQVSYDLRWIPQWLYAIAIDTVRIVRWVWLLWFWGCAIHRGWLIRPSALLITLGAIMALLSSIILPILTYLVATA